MTLIAEAQDSKAAVLPDKSAPPAAVPIAIPKDAMDRIEQDEDGQYVMRPKTPPEKEEKKVDKSNPQTKKAEPEAGKDAPSKATVDPDKGKQGAVKEGEAPEGQPAAGPEAEQKANEDFKGKIASLVERFHEVYKTPEERDKILKDLENHPKFTASNTQEAMRNAEFKKNLEQTAEELSIGPLRDTLNEITKAGAEIEDQLALIDDMVEGGKDKNLLRKLIDLMTKAAPAAEKVNAESQRQADKEEDLRLEEMVINLKKLTDSPINYQDEAEVQKTMAVADKYEIADLMAAHQIRAAEALQMSVKNMKTEIESLQKELKERNEEVKALKSGKVIVPEPQANNGKPAKREDYKEPAKNDAELRERMGKRFDELMAEPD